MNRRPTSSLLSCTASVTYPAAVMAALMLLGGGLAAQASLWTGVAHAQTDEERAQARAAFTRGNEMVAAENYQAALAAFQEAYRLAPHPVARYNMANCYQALNRPVEALFHFERYLAEAEGLTRARRREVQRTVQTLQGQIVQLSFRIVPDGATVTIDQSETRRAPIMESIRLDPGHHVVSVRMQGYQTVRQELDLAAGAEQTVEIRLDRPSTAQAQVTATGNAGATNSTATNSTATNSTAGTNTGTQSTGTQSTGTQSTGTQGTQQVTVATTQGGTANTTQSGNGATQTQQTGTSGSGGVEVGAGTGSGSVVAVDDPETGSQEEGGGFELRLTTPVIISGAAAGVLAVAGLISGVVALSQNNAFEAAVTRSNDQTLSAAERAQAREDGLAAADGANAASIAHDIFLIGTVMAAGLATFFLILSADEPEQDQDTAGIEPSIRLTATPSVSQQGGGLLLSGSF